MDAARGRRGRVNGPPPALQDALAGALARPAVLIGRGDDIPPVPGAYLVIADLPEGLALSNNRFAGMTVAPGWYVYAGSARGTGGLRARVGRHLRREKPLCWHIDQVTARAEDLHALCVAEKGECDLVEALLASNRFDAPIPGFGSSDCRACPAHLLRWGDA